MDIFPSNNSNLTLEEIVEKDNLTLHHIKDASFDSFQNGAHIYFKQYFPKKKLKKKITHIIFQHGAIEYHKRHEELFDELRKRFSDNLIISCMDLLGHGLSGGARAYIKDFNIYIQDFLRFSKVLQSIYLEHEVKTIVIGHSLGGMILLKTLIDYKDEIPFSIDAAIYTNPCIRPKIHIPKLIKTSVNKFSSRVGKLRLPSLYDGFDLTNDRNRAIAFNNDHLNSHFITIKMGMEILKVSNEMLTMSYFYDVPSLFLLSPNDIIVDTKVTELFIAGIDKKLVSFKKYKNCMHDILNDTCRNDAFKEIINFIEKIK